MCQNSCIPGVPCCIFVFQAEDDFLNKKETFKPKVKKNNLQLKKTTYVYKTSNSTHHPVPTETQRFPDRFSFGSR